MAGPCQGTQTSWKGPREASFDAGCGGAWAPSTSTGPKNTVGLCLTSLGPDPSSQQDKSPPGTLRGPACSRWVQLFLLPPYRPSLPHCHLSPASQANGSQVHTAAGLEAVIQDLGTLSSSLPPLGPSPSPQLTRKTLSREILPSSDRMVVWASCVTAYSGSSTP